MSTLDEAVKLLRSIKERAEHARRFGVDGPQSLSDRGKLLTAIEGDVEEWLIENGFLQSSEE